MKIHKNMRRSLIILYLQETFNNSIDYYSSSIRKYFYRLTKKDKLKILKQRDNLIKTYNTRQGVNNYEQE